MIRPSDEQALADELLAHPLHPEVHRLLLLFPLKRLTFTATLSAESTPKVITLALRLDDGRHYNNPAGAYVAQHQSDEVSALWAALHYKLGRHMTLRAAALGSWSYNALLEKQYQAARERREVVSTHALSSPEAYFAELLAEAVVRQADDPPSAIFNVTLDL
ncbi:hypothetical protein [Deinococcus alpinitundrae]|uniref:hypothetical protein n=1 Tax=Deinococcus alpinitundrae TaxID=468913 RepID=UPI00137A0237|nr:hypothetical protein [Deinococcus alpinitundrae]